MSEPAAPAGYYRHHVFFCLNQRSGGEACCASNGAEAAFEHCKQKIKALKAHGPGGVRINRAGCLDRCAGAPVVVVYPDETWYTYVDTADLDEIIESHLIGGQPVQRLLLAPDVGR